MQENEIQKVAPLLAEISAVLISSGANTRRALRNVERIAQTLGYDTEIFHSYSGVILSVCHKQTREKESVVLTIKNHGVNFNIISAISILSWQVVEQKLSVEQLEKEFSAIKNQPQNNLLITWLFASLAGGALAFIFGGENGSYIEFGIAFVATFIGLFSRRLLQLKNFNPFICWAWAAFVSVSVVNVFRIFGVQPISNALAACVLWLIPGVPLITGFIDLLTGYIVSGWAKISTASVLVFMIALGFFLSLKLFGYELL